VIKQFSQGKNMKSKHLTLIICIILTVILVGLLFNKMKDLPRIEGQLLWFIIGILIGVIFILISSKRIVNNILLHELTHALWAKIFRADVGTIMASKRRGGYISHKGTLRWALPLVSLAPYFFPLIPLVLILLKLLVKPVYLQPFAFLIGFTLLLFYYDLYRTLKVPQQDIKETGVAYSVAFMIFSNIFFLCVILFSLIN